MMEPFILPGEGMPIHSLREDFLFLRGNERDASTAHIVLAGDINLALPINLLDGGGSFASCSFGGTFVETIFLDEGFPSFCLPIFGSFSVDC